MARKEHILRIYCCCGFIGTQMARGKIAQMIWDDIRFRKGGCWTDYNEGLVRRGCISGSLCWTDGMDLELSRMNAGKVGRPFGYPDSMVEYARRRHARDGIDYRSLEGELREILKFVGKKAISYSQMFKRCKKLDRMGAATIEKDPKWVHAMNAINRSKVDGKGIVAAADVTGMKLTVRGEWMREKWKIHRGWVKLHALADTATGKVLSYCITTDETADHKTLQTLVDDAVTRGHALDHVYMDGSYDTKAVWRGMKERGIGMTANIRKNARTNSRGWMERTHAAIVRNMIGDKLWKLIHRYGTRWRIECVFSDLKRVMGEALSARSFAAMEREIDAKICLHNMFKDVVARTMVDGGE
jgi:hypothetical protein